MPDTEPLGNKENLTVPMSLDERELARRASETAFTQVPAADDVAAFVGEVRPSLLRMLRAKLPSLNTPRGIVIYGFICATGTAATVWNTTPVEEPSTTTMADENEPQPNSSSSSFQPPELPVPAIISSAQAKPVLSATTPVKPLNPPMKTETPNVPRIPSTTATPPPLPPGFRDPLAMSSEELCKYDPQCVDDKDRINTVGEMNGLIRELNKAGALTYNDQGQCVVSPEYKAKADRLRFLVEKVKTKWPHAKMPSADIIAACY